MAGKVREKIRLVSTAKNKNGKATGTFRTTTKNKRSEGGREKLNIKKFDPRAYNAETGKSGMHVVFKEEKIK